jgi:hypothetical protein
MAGITPSGGSAITCTFVKGEVGALKERTEVWQRPGIDGYGAMTLGLGDSGFEFECVLYDTFANIGSWIDDINACQGQVCGVTNDWNVTWSSLLVQRVSVPKIQPTTDTSAQIGRIMIAGVQVA